MVSWVDRRIVSAFGGSFLGVAVSEPVDDGVESSVLLDNGLYVCCGLVNFEAGDDPRQQLFSQAVGEVTIRGWNDGTFDVVDDWMLPAAAQFDTYEGARTWADNYNNMEA